MRFALVFAFLGACSASLQDNVRDAAASDLGCPRDAIRVTDEGDGHYLAEGCSTHARYAFHPPGQCTRGTCPYRAR